MAKPRFEVAHVFRQYGCLYRKTHGPKTSQAQWRVFHAIETCRTEALGGHVEQCDSCGHQVISYNSCRNRHCPKCQTKEKTEWLKRNCSYLLPVQYFHVVFTVPDSLTPIAQQNKRVFYNVLFRAASTTLLTIAGDPKHLGAEIGFIAILHTWGQNLMPHPHLHCVVPGGGISQDGKSYVTCPEGFFLPVRVLSRLFRRLFLQFLKEAFEKDLLEFHGKTKELSTPEAFLELLASLRQKEWVVYSKPPFGGPEKVLDYLGRYTHRVAISNDRILDINQGKVTFLCKDYKREGRRVKLTLGALEFIRRFLLHTLPHGFVRIRYYGLLANRKRREKLQVCKKLLSKTQEIETQEIFPKEEPEGLGGYSLERPHRCPKCGTGQMVRLRIIPRPPLFCARGPPGIQS